MSPPGQPKIASTEVRLVPFSHLYHGMMRNLTLKIEAERVQGANHDYHHEVANVVVLAALVLESAINEIAYWLAARFEGPIAMPEDLSESSIRFKWQEVARRCGAPGFNKLGTPWVDLDTLVTLRNALVHADAYPGAPLGVLTFLEARDCAQPAMDWFESIMTRRTARWATATATAMPVALTEMIAPYVDLKNGGGGWLWGPEWFHPISTPPV